MLDIAGAVQQGENAEEANPLALRNRLDALTSQQAALLEEVLKDMDNEELNAQLMALTEEKQNILDQLGALQQTQEHQIGLDARRRELAEWLDQHEAEFTEYEDTITRKYVEKITVLDAETICIKFRYTEIEIDKNLRG